MDHQTKAAFCIRHIKIHRKQTRIASAERNDADVAAGGYESIAIGLAAALTQGGQARLILNVRNGGTVPALAADAVIETVCLVDRDGAVPLPVSPPSDHELGLMCMVKSCERAIVTAALTGSADAALRAFADATGKKLGQVAQPLRAALTGRVASPGIDATLAAPRALAAAATAGEPFV